MRLARRAPDVAIALAVFAVAWGLRAAAPAAFVTWDEPAWVYRSASFLLALQRGDLAGTLQVGHPGVLTMWGGALSLAWHRGVTGLVQPGQLEAVAATPWQIHDADLLRQLGALLPLARSAMPLLHAVLIALACQLLRRLAGRGPAVVGAAMLLGDPFALAHGRVLHLDALAGEALLAALLATLLYARTGRRRPLALAGALWGVALLTKSTSVLLGPVGVGILAVRAAWTPLVPPERRAGRAVADVAVWIACAATVYVALWPAMWLAPRAALASVLGLSVQYGSQDAGATSTFFLGQVRADAGPFFYPVALWFRSAPLTVAGTVLALASVIVPCGRLVGEGRIGTHGGTRAGLAERAAVRGTLAFALSYLALLTLGLKKFDRYALPAMLALDVTAALGWCWALGALSWRRGWLAPVLGGVMAVAQGVLLLAPLAPAHYLAYYNPLAGGIAGALRALPVGWGEGVEQAAAYLAEEPGAAGRTVATWAVAGIAPRFPGRVIPLTREALPQADRLVLTVSDMQVPDDVASRIMVSRIPAWVGQVRGVDWVFVYDNPFGAAESDMLLREARAGDLAVANLPSTIQRDDRSAAKWLVPGGSDDASIAAELREAFAAAPAAGQPRRVFLLSFDAAPGSAADRRSHALTRLLAANALRESDAPGLYGSLRVYRLLDDALIAAMPERATSATFGGRLALEGYGLARTTIQHRQEAGIALRWRAGARVDQDLHVSLQVVDGDANLWGQRDLPLRNDEGHGTSAWAPQSAVTTRATVPIEAGAPPGQYTVQVRVYALEDMRPLEVVDGTGQAVGGAWPLAALEVMRPLLPPADDELPAAQRVTMSLSGRMAVLGYTLAPEALEGGLWATLTLFWRCERIDAQRYLLELSLRREGESVVVWRGDPAGAAYPSALWVEGDVLRYPYRFRAPADLRGGDYTVWLSLLEAATGAPVGAPQALASVTIARAARLWEAPTLSHVQEATFGGAIALLGYDLSPSPVPGGSLRVTLCWQALAAPPADYTVFAHLLDAQGRVAAQHDGAPDAGRRPTGGWVEGEVVLDSHDLAIPPDLAPGDYRLEVGLYDASTGERPPVTQGGEASPERRVLLSQVVRLGG